MWITQHIIDLSRSQFAFTAMFHFIFVPLTLGMTWMLVIMESCYVITGKQVYKDMTRFWGLLFGINFALGVATGLTMEFQFGLNWAYFSQYVGNVFGVPLAIEGMLAFMLESAFVGIFFFGWDRIGKVQHLFVTLFLAIGSNLSAMVILVANGWMQHPVGSSFDPHTLRYSIDSFITMWSNPDAQVRFVHTISAGYTTASIFVLGVSSYYLLKGRDLAFAKRSFIIASGFGLAAILSALYLGDANGVLVAADEKAKLAGMEAQWETAPAPAPWLLIAFPDQKQEKNYGTISIPWVLSLIVNHSLTETVPGLIPIMKDNRRRIHDGMKAYTALQKIRKGDNSKRTMATFKKYEDNLGYGLLLKRYRENVAMATPHEVNMAVKASIPNVPILFWGFRFMVAMGFLMLLVFVLANIFWLRGSAWNKKWFLRCCLYIIPAPWIAVECGWVIAEMGRQPWLVNGILPTFLGASSVSTSQIVGSFLGLVAFYAVLLAIELFLMFKYARKGPSALNTGRYHFEKSGKV
tara:strand:+ start:24702 stop:26264 length:1563 start_codon:yes stop_codon:yes gene_type:complete